MRLQRRLLAAWRAKDDAPLVLTRQQLHDRIDLELRVMRGFRDLALVTGLFACVVGVMLLCAGASSELGLMHTYTEMLGLDQLAELKTTSALTDFLKGLSQRTQKMLPMSQV